MTCKTKITFYCDAVGCDANQTFIVRSTAGSMTVITSKGEVPVLGALVQQRGWSAGMGRVAGAGHRSVTTYCPEHSYRGNS